MHRPILDGIVGARPNMMKMAPLARALAADGTFELRLIHTGQHYDHEMSEVFFRELGLPPPSFNLEVGSGSPGAQTARIIERYESIIVKEGYPRGVIVVGDVNSTVACSLTAAKHQIPVAHVEAGLRSGDRSMPEEINRIVTDALSDVLLVSDPDGLIHLAREGKKSEEIRLVGNIMIDTLLRELPAAEKSSLLSEYGLKPKEYAFLTMHRPSNVDDPEVLRRIIRTVEDLSRDMPFVFAVHPRTKRRLDEAGITLVSSDRFRIIDSLGYRDTIRILQCAFAVLTDSGGIQEETSILNVPCLTLRNNTERPVTVQLGTSQLVGNDEARLRGAWQRVKAGRWKQANAIPLWDGMTSGRIVTCLKEFWG